MTLPDSGPDVRVCFFATLLDSKGNESVPFELEGKPMFVLYYWAIHFGFRVGTVRVGLLHLARPLRPCEAWPFCVLPELSALGPDTLASTLGENWQVATLWETTQFCFCPGQRESAIKQGAAITSRFLLSGENKYWAHLCIGSVNVQFIVHLGGHGTH